MPRALIFSQALSAAHAVRPLLLAQWLRDDNWQVEIACGEHHRPWFARAGLPATTISSPDARRAYERLRRGAGMFEADEIIHHHQEDAALIDDLRPDVVCADFRFSALEQARARGLATVGLTDVTCHPAFPFAGPAPDNLLATSNLPGWLFTGLANSPLGAWLRRAHLRDLAAPLRAASRAVGLPALGDFQDYAAQGDLCLLFDEPTVMPLPQLRPQDLYVGACDWDPGTALPDHVQRFCAEGPVVYVSAGTQEAVAAQALVDGVRAILHAGLRVVLSMGGRHVSGLPAEDPRLLVVDFVNQARILDRIDLFVHPSGGMSCYQALRRGVPMLLAPAIATQHYYAIAVEDIGAGRRLQQPWRSPAALAAATRAAAGDIGLRARARWIAQELPPPQIESVVRRLHALADASSPRHRALQAATCVMPPMLAACCS